VSDDRPFNNLLRALRAKDYALIARHMELGQSPAKELIYNPGENVATVYFPCGPSLVSLLVTNEDGHDLPAYCRIVVKNGGAFVRLHVNDLEAAKARSSSLHSLFARYADCLLAQVFQSTACNAIHSIEQRSAKWIISTMERKGDQVLPLTQEQLAGMLGVGRSYTSRVIQTFKAEGILETRRGSIVVRNRAALEARSCLCNESVKRHFDEVLRGVYPSDGR
jgi:DNA-binding transcriptional regulator YhcF (GntR family)